MFENIPLPNLGTQAASLLAGALLLLLGRRLFWLFVGIVGFLVGLNLALQYLGGQQPGWVVLLAALFLGIIGAVLAIFLQTAAVALAGFVVGGYLTVEIVRQLFSLNLGQLEWVIFIVAGIIGAVLLVFVFDAALIVISSLAGAALVIQGTGLGQPLALILFVVLVLIGIVVQSQTVPARRADTTEVAD